jgi:uncharacterized membrane protein
MGNGADCGDTGDAAWIGQLHRVLAEAESVWRQRLDVTAGWAVPLELALVTLALSERTVPHFVLLVLGWALIFSAALVEARRFRVLVHSAWRASLIERGYYAPHLEAAPEERGWRAALAADLRRPALQTSRWDALRSRFRATYTMLSYMLTLAWLAKLAIHPSPAGTPAALLARMHIGGLVPWWGVLSAAIAMVVVATWMALAAPPDASLRHGRERALEQPSETPRPPSRSARARGPG